MRRALLSVSNRTGLLEFAAGLLARGFEIVSTGGTARTLAGAGVPVIGVSSVTGFPELLDGRVKTLHPAIHAGILARRRRPDDLAALERHHMAPIDLVAVNLYPFVEAAERSDLEVDALIEEIDIGGPALVRAAAKSFTDVLVVVDPVDYPELLSALDAPEVGLPLRLCLAQKAFAHTAAYDAAVASTIAELEVATGGLERRRTDPDRAPARLFVVGRKIRDLRYGENPHQDAAWYATSPGGFGSAQVLQGKELSYTNLLDLDAGARLVAEFDEPAAAILKHTNPCGVAVAGTIADAYERARDADALSAFGGSVALNRALDHDTAERLTATFIEAVIAPAVNEDARAILATKGALRVVATDFVSVLARRTHGDVRTILGGVLLQTADRVREAERDWPAGELRVVTRRPPTPEEWDALRFAWRVVAHVKSNAVVFTNASRTLAIGAGQMSRVDAVRVATIKTAGGALAGSVAASDAFFPFRDGLDAVAAAGATAVVQPGGSVRDREVIAAADEHGLAMVFTGRRHFRH